ncbi:peptidase S41 [Alloprevotella sp. OH1205_COT-284]|uniref:peptidase S41 n=1 Tax=Alloprevotella sp. OH1205_COT-284 TaxID=2491043 RepID=UPI000F5E1F80|nr:peptidase S41 [Alloprevotella sp. OH1205_COT-284]RRD80435.1 peptidase S41 [Alloprevotella sp. OH1205_COT-284]
MMEHRHLLIDNSVFIPQIRELLREGHTARFKVRGWSMRVFVEHDRDEVLLAQCDTTQLKIGDVVLAEIAPLVYVLHRIINVQSDLLTLQGDGNVGMTEHCRRSEVIGIAQGFYRKGSRKPDLTSGLKWRIYSQIWLSLTPIRRYILFIYRRLWLRFFRPI